MAAGAGPHPAPAQQPQDQVDDRLPALLEEVAGEVVAAERPPNPYRVQRPAWLGLRAEHRAAARAASWAATKALLARAVWECWRGMPRRVRLVIRWFFLGMRGWLVLARWAFAIREREDLRLGQAAQLVKPGRGATIGRHSDHLAWWRCGIVVVPHVAAMWACEYYLGGWLWLAGMPAAILTTVFGAIHDERKLPPVVAPRRRESVTVESMNAALRAVGILDRPTNSDPTPEGVRLASYPRRIGVGLETRWDLPPSCGREALDVVKLRGRLAGAYATPRDRFLVEVGAHESQFIVWQATTDPFGGPIPEHPLLDVTEWDVWTPAPFGRDARGRTVTMPLVFTSHLIGARPRRGKSFSARSALAGAALDPHVRFYCADGKGGGTWAALEPLCEPGGFITGCDTAEVVAVVRLLEGLVADMRARAKRIPGSKITPESSRDRAVDAPVTVVIVDEAQEYLSDPEHGPRIETALTTLAKVGPSSGFCPVVITQRPDEKSFPTGLRAVMGSRFALQVMSYHDSNVILGPDMSKLGHDASKITHRGVGLLRPDDDANGEPDADSSVRLVRTFDMSDEGGAWEAICARGLELRAEVARGLGQVEEAVGDELLPATAFVSRFRRYAPQVLPEQVVDAQSMGNWLGGLGIKATRLPSGVRVRSRVSVEVAVGVPKGCLAGDGEPAGDTPDRSHDTGSAPSRHPHRHRHDTGTED